MPKPSQLVAFMAEWECTGHGTRACDATATDFMIDKVGTLKSPWNISAGQVFTSYIIEKVGYRNVEETQKAVEKAFYTRLKSLKSLCSKDRLSLTEQ